MDVPVSVRLPAFAVAVALAVVLLVGAVTAGQSASSTGAPAAADYNAARGSEVVAAPLPTGDQTPTASAPATSSDVEVQAKLARLAALLDLLSRTEHLMGQAEAIYLAASQDVKAGRTPAVVESMIDNDDLVLNLEHQLADLRIKLKADPVGDGADRLTDRIATILKFLPERRAELRARYTEQILREYQAAAQTHRNAVERIRNEINAIRDSLPPTATIPIRLQITADADHVIFQGEPMTWPALAEALDRVPQPQRAATQVRIESASRDMSVGHLGDAYSRLRRLLASRGFVDITLTVGGFPAIIATQPGDRP